MRIENGRSNGQPPPDFKIPSPAERVQEQREVTQILSQLTGCPISVSVLHEPEATRVEFIIQKGGKEEKEQKETNPVVLEKRQRRSHNVSLHTGPLRRGKRGWHENGRYYPPKETKNK